MTEPILTASGNADIDRLPFVNGNVDIRKTHPLLYLGVMVLAVMCILLAANFFWLKPAFEVYHLSNYVWASAFLTLGVTKLWFLNIYRSIIWIRRVMQVSFSYIFFFAIGTCEPWLDGQGSLQLPIMYFGMAAVLFLLLIEPYLNLWTARPDSQGDE